MAKKKSKRDSWAPDDGSSEVSEEDIDFGASPNERPQDEEEQLMKALNIDKDEFKTRFDKTKQGLEEDKKWDAKPGEETKITIEAVYQKMWEDAESKIESVKADTQHERVVATKEIEKRKTLRNQTEQFSKPQPQVLTKPQLTVKIQNAPILPDDKLKELKTVLFARFDKYINNSMVIKVHKDRARAIQGAIEKADSLEMINTILANQTDVLDGKKIVPFNKEFKKVGLDERFTTSAQVKTKVSNLVDQFFSDYWKTIKESQNKIIPDFLANNSPKLTSKGPKTK